MSTAVQLALAQALREAADLVDFLPNHLTGRMGEAALNDMRLKAEAWREKLVTHEADRARFKNRVNCGECAGTGYMLRDREAEKALAAAPDGWTIEGSDYVWRGEFAEIDAKNEARRVGGTCRAFPIYREAPAAPVAAPLTDELTGKLMRIHAALGKMGKKYGEIGSRDVDVARWNADLHEAIAAVGDVLAHQPLEKLARIKLEGGQG